MEKASFSVANYFDRLQRKAHEIDEDLENLSKTWRTPHLLIGGYAERTAETDSCLEKLWESVRSTSDGLEQLQLEAIPLVEATDLTLEDLQEMFENLKQECDDLGIVLEEFGYHYEENNESEDRLRNDSQACTNDSLLTTKEMPDVEVEFTPDLTWKCKAKSKESDQ